MTFPAKYINLNTKPNHTPNPNPKPNTSSLF